jgi:hypothetical protein
MRVRRRWTFLVATAVVAAVGTAGCSDSTGSADPADEGNGPDGYSVSAMLAEVPAADAGEGVLLQTAYLRAATEAAGLAYPTSGSRVDVSPWLIARTVGEIDGEPSPVFVPMASSFNLDTATTEEFADGPGWSVLDVDTFVEQATPPTTFSVVTGNLADDALADDLVETKRLNSALAS